MAVCGKVRHDMKRSGFTLIELIVALAIISIAGTVFVSMYLSSMEMGRTARNRTMAARLADEQLNTLVRHPEQYQWNIPAEPNVEPFPITLAGSQGSTNNAVGQPSVMPLNQNAFRREETLYNNFHWTARGRFPNLNSAFCEVTVVVHWVESGRPQMLALTSALPRFQLPEGEGKP